MKLLPPILCFLLPISPMRAMAVENWETCLDKGDFSYASGDPILSGSSTNLTKAGCKFNFTVLGGRGEKFELDVCDPSVHVDHFATLESAGHRVLAQPAGCPAPTFGADFDANAKQVNEYKVLRTSVFEMLDKVRDFYAEELTKAGFSSPYDKSNIALLEAETDPKDSNDRRAAKLTAGRLACAHFLLREYLNRCLSFEAKKTVPAARPPHEEAPLIGVHPQTIPKK